MGEPVIAREVAEVDFERMCKSRRIVTDEEEMGVVAFAIFSIRRDELLKVMMRGELIVAQDGTPTFTPSGGPESVTFQKATGATFMAMDAHDGNMHKVVAALADMAHKGGVVFSKMERPDFHVCTTLCNLFMAQ